MILVLVGLFTYLAVVHHGARAVRPAPWRELKRSLITSVLGVLLVIVWFGRWGEWNAAAKQYIGATALVFLGFASVGVGLMDRGRRVWLGWAIPIMLLGFFVPYCTPRQINLGVNVALLMGGLLAAAILSHQLRGQRHEQHAH
jgi:hypothetical protein